MLHRRLGLNREVVGGISALQGPVLPAADTLFDQAFAMAPEDPVQAQVILAAALLAESKAATEGRLAAALSLLARLVAKADPRQTLGPEGSWLRGRIMPNGWRYTAKSWPRLRYAWREGMRELLNLGPGEAGLETVGRLEAETGDEAVADALDEVTRISAAEPEPVAVAIQETFPAPRIGFAITVIGLGLSFYGVYTTYQRERQIEQILRRRR